MDWYGCWGCQHCLTVCPNGAISVLGKKPENSLPLPSDAISEDPERLVCSRRSCRHYKDENVDPELLNELLAALEATPDWTEISRNGIQRSLMTRRTGQTAQDDL